MKIVMLGAPGSGKGTQAKFISSYYNIPNISTGDLFRKNIENKTTLGIKVTEIMKTGKLCPDDLTIEMVKDRLKKDDCKNGYLLDGFPRNIYQAETLDKISSPDKVFNVDIALEKIEKRTTGRRVCSSCHSSFHVDSIG
ncbi:MAG: nucleoside monophosphate kinase, partial [Firmicutes bacterium]|nr:nucleoside monophosphate kinase [Candidatus Caballimonas caccae]